MTATVTTAASAAGLLVQVTGVIDDSFHLGEVADQRQRCIVFDLSGIERVTSYGVREWMRALDDVDADYYCFVRVSPAIICQFNLVAGFGRRGEVVSLYAPYACTSCGEVSKRLFDLRQLSATALGTLPSIPCERCGEIAEFDDVEHLYFDYVSRANPPRPPAHASALIDGKSAVSHRFRAEKLVVDSLTILRLWGTVDRSAYFRRLADGLQGTVAFDLGGVTELGAEGIAGLGEVAARPDLDVYIARVPSELLGAIAAGLFHPGAPCRARLVTVWADWRCGGCGRVEPRDFEVDPGARETTAPCERCPSLLSFDAAAVLALLESIPCAPAPMELLRVLANRGTTTSTPRPLLLDKYQVERRIGRGGMGEVFLARHIGPAAFRKLVVLKRIRRDLLDSPEIVESFLQEASIGAKLSHRNIVQIFDFARVEGEYLMAMEHVVGLDLEESLKLSRANAVVWPISICCTIASELCAGLQAAHGYRDEQGVPVPVIHRDVSPSNILLGSDGSVKLTDFGVARIRGRASTTEPGTFKGKQEYAAPEQVLGASGPDPRLDIYSAGVVLYECLTLCNYRPAALRLARREKTAPARLLAQRPDAPPELERVVDRALALRPEDRYPSAQELRDDLERIMRDRNEHAGSETIGAWVVHLGQFKTQSGASGSDGIATTGSGRLESATSDIRTVPGFSPPPATEVEQK